MPLSPDWLHLPLLYTTIGIVLSLSSTAVIGTFTALQKKELIGDVLAHASLPGITIAFVITGTKDTFFLTLGAFVSSKLALFLIEYLTTYKKVKKDTALAFTLAFFWGIGLVGLTYIQKNVEGEAGGLEHILFGNAASLTRSNSFSFVFFAFLLLLVLALLFRQWRLICFDPEFAESIGLPMRFLRPFFSCLTVLGIVIGVHAVGIVLMASLLITPPTVARYWTSSLLPMLLLSAFFSSLGGVTGVALSYYYSNLRTGPCIVVCLTVIAFFSFFFAPKKGFLAREWTQYQYRKKIFNENILKLFCEIAEEDNNEGASHHINTLLAKRPLDRKKSLNCLKRLTKNGFVTHSAPNRWQITPKGAKQGKTILRRHILWEEYLRKVTKMNPTQRHDNAESIEHLISSRMEEVIEESLKEKGEKD